MWLAQQDTSGQPPGNGWQQILSAPRGKQGPAGKSIVGPQGKPGRNGADAVLPENFIEDVMALASERKRFEDGRSSAEAITSFRGYFDASETYRSGDVVNFDGALFLCHSGGRFESIARSQDSWEVMLSVPKFTSPAYMLWMGDYELGRTYKGGMVVTENGWTTVALTETNDYPVPSTVGNPVDIYEGLSPTTNDTAKQIISGNRYTNPDRDFQINAYRVYTIAGNSYVIYSVTGTLAEPVFTQLENFTASSSGWRTFNIASQIVLAGSRFDLVSLVTEPDPTPTTWNGNWSYSTPQNPSAPLPGQAVQANSTPGVLAIHFIDNDSGDREAELSALSVGDQIEAGGLIWAIQTITLNADYVSFAVAPTVQIPVDGVTNFVFETVEETPITYLEDTDYWLGTDFAVNGIVAIDVPYEQATVNDSAYGIDLNISYLRQSEDWDIVSAASSVSGGANGSQLRTDIVLETSNYTDQIPTGLGVPLQVIFGSPDTTTWWSVDAAGAMTCLVTGTYTLRLKTQAGRRDVAGVAQIYTRVLINGSQVGDSSHVIMSSDDFEIPQFYNSTLTFTAGDILTVEIVRDTDGVDSGGLYAGNPDVVGWNPSPSAKIEITRSYIS
jgi:hypothetical protein